MEVSTIMRVDLDLFWAETYDAVNFEQLTELQLFQPMKFADRWLFATSLKE